MDTQALDIIYRDKEYWVTSKFNNFKAMYVVFEIFSNLEIQK